MLLDLLTLLIAGVAGGFLGGLVGVGGGVIFAPVLFYYFQAVGVAPDLVTPLTLGTSLFCTMVVSVFSAQTQFKKKSVEGQTALYVGISSAVAVVVLTTLVTTRPWYTTEVFQIVFALLLVSVAVQMSLRGRIRDTVTATARPTVTAAVNTEEPSGSRSRRHANAPALERGGGKSTKRSRNLLRLLLTGTAAGTVATAAGVGGGIVLVPIYRKLFALPIHRAVGTSSATIVLISLAGVLSYVLGGWDLRITTFSLGYVDFGRAVLLSIPAAFMARIGARTAHRLNQTRLSRSFALVAVVVAIRMLLKALDVI